MTESKDDLARPILYLTLLAELSHVCLLLFLHRSLLGSNLFQLFFPLLALAVSLRERARGVDPISRRYWSAIAFAFGIWSAGQALFIYFLYFPEFRLASVRPDDALWILFGMPILLAVTTTHEELDRVQWLDRAQTFLFFAVLYLLVFLPSERLSLSHAYLIQNLALFLCCLLRLPICTTASERRFFLRLTGFLLIYGGLETVGELLYRRGWQVGGPVDLIWTVPVACFVASAARDALRAKEQGDESSRLLTAVRRMQGLSVAALAFLSIGVSALLASRHPLIGSASVVCCFALFALRTNAREDIWHQAHRRLEQTLLKDALTGLGNRILLRNSLTERLQQRSVKGSVVLLFADLDRFKSINDTLGHALGDRLLIEVGQRLSAAAPPDSIVCRLGGDEFVVLTSADGPAEAQASGETLLEALHAPFQLGDHVLRCTTSIGVVFATPGAEVDHLLRTADHAMYRAKQLGKDRVQLFDASLLEQLNRRWQMETDLRECVEQNGIDVAFQPILSVEGGQISGFEALARWTHPVRGNVPPLEFIPLAEDTGLILPLGAQVLEKACRQIAEWNRAWETTFSVSVNVSPRQFADTGLLNLLLSTLDRTGLHPSLLRLEITESALLVHESTVRQVLAEARAHGIRISLDDFGTGYSSLSFLLNLPVDEVKVDRSFVSDMHRDPQRREVVRTVVQLGHSLGKRVVAEGVETEHDLRELVAMGCECAQGWLISKPLLADALEADMPAITARNARTLLRTPELPPAHRHARGWDQVLRSPVGLLEQPQ